MRKKQIATLSYRKLYLNAKTKMYFKFYSTIQQHLQLLNTLQIY